MSEHTQPDARPVDADSQRVTTDDAPGAEDRSFQTRPGDVEPSGENTTEPAVAPRSTAAPDERPDPGLPPAADFASPG